VWIDYSAHTSQPDWLNLPHSDHVTVDKHFKTLYSDYAVRLARKTERLGRKRLREICFGRKTNEIVKVSILDRKNEIRNFG